VRVPGPDGTPGEQLSSGCDHCRVPRPLYRVGVAALCSTCAASPSPNGRRPAPVEARTS